MKLDSRRQFCRISLDRKVYLEFEGNSYDCCEIKNISLGGMFIAGSFSQDLDDDCHVYIYHDPNTNSPCLNASANVVRKTDEGIGVKFTSITYKNYMILLTTLINNIQQVTSTLYESLDSYPVEIIKN